MVDNDGKNNHLLAFFSLEMMVVSHVISILYLLKQDEALLFFSDYLFQSQDGQEHSGPFIRRCTPDKKEVITFQILQHFG